MAKRERVIRANPHDEPQGSKCPQGVGMREEPAEQALVIEVAWCTENKTDEGGYCQNSQQSGHSSGKAIG